MINHKADKAKCLGPTRKMGPIKVKNEKKDASKAKNEDPARGLQNTN